MSSSTIIRSSKLSISHANVGKKVLYETFLDEFRRVFKLVLDELWTWENVPVLIKHKQFSHIETTLSSQMLQVILKQCSGLIRGTKMSAWALGKVPTKPKVNAICPELDQRMVKTNWENNGTSFDCILTIQNLSVRGSRLKIVIPVKKTKHFNKLNSKGILRKGCRLSKKGVTFMFDIPVEKRTEGVTLGVDVGISDLWTDSVGNRSTEFKHTHNWTLTKILKRLSQRKKGSKGFKRTQDLRDNFINWSINQLNLKDVKELKIENIKDMRKGKKCDRLRSHWTYTKIFHKLESRSAEFGVQILKIDPRNTSRKCSVCGVVDVKSRNGKVFKCVACGHTQDADLNAALNISRSDQIQNRGVYSPSNKKTR